MSIKTEVTREPARGEVVTRLDLVQPKRGYVVRSATKDGSPDHFAVLGASPYGDRGKGENMRVMLSDLREVAAMLIAHADELGLPEKPSA